MVVTLTFAKPVGLSTPVGILVQDSAFCFALTRICREELEYPADASTSRMRSHLKNVHREIYDTDKGFIPKVMPAKPLGNPDEQCIPLLLTLHYLDHSSLSLPGSM